MAPLTRTSGGTIKANTEWLHIGGHRQTLSARYEEFAAEVEALLVLVDEVLDRGVESDVSLLPSNVWRAFGPPP